MAVLFVGFSSIALSVICSVKSLQCTKQRSRSTLGARPARPSEG